MSRQLEFEPFSACADLPWKSPQGGWVCRVVNKLMSESSNRFGSGTRDSQFRRDQRLSKAVTISRVARQNGTYDGSAKTTYGKFFHIFLSKSLSRCFPTS